MEQKPLKLSPSSLDLFLECPCCFWLNKRQGIKRPPPYPYGLNIAMDILLKREFDNYRAKGEPHPLLIANNIKATLFPNQDLLNKWRNNFQGIYYYDSGLGAALFGVVDDILEFPDGKLAPLDYKSTGSTVPQVYDRFQLQMDTYTFLLEKNGYETTRKGYLAFYVVDRKSGFDDRLPFKKELHEVETNPTGILEIFKEAIQTLERMTPPSHSRDCQFGKWLKEVNNI